MHLDTTEGYYMYIIYDKTGAFDYGSIINQAILKYNDSLFHFFQFRYNRNKN